MSLDRWSARLVFAGKALVVCALLAAVGVLVVRAQRHRTRQERHLVDLAVWRPVELPSWATRADAAALRDATGLVGRALPLYDRDACEIVRRALERAPGTARVVSMRRVLPAEIEVVMELRRPAAAVVVPGVGYVEVDAAGRVLGAPARERPVRDGVPMRIVSGGSLPPAPGKVCAEDVRAGVDLCRQLDDYRDGLGARILRTFDEVDVSNHGGRVAPAASALLLRAARPPGTDDRPTGCVVEWGRLEARYGEPAFDEKAARLERAIAVFGEFEGVARVRVAFETLSVLPVDGPEGAWLPALADQTFGR